MSSLPVDRDFGHRIAWLLGAVLLLRLLYAGCFPLDLSADESYYWDWGRRPDWGYFSKPPLVAWLLAGLRLAGWDTPTGLRLAAALLSAGLVPLVHGLGRELYGVRAGRWAAALLALTPAYAVLGLAFTPDLPLLLCWSGALWAFWCWQRSGGRGSALVLVACLGLGLLAKQSMLAFFPLALLYLATGRATRGLLRRPGTWLGAAAALAFLLPVLAWNGRHGWITLLHTAAHFEAPPPSAIRAGRDLAALLGAQLALLGPVTCALVAAGVSLSLWHPGRLEPGARYLACMGALPLAAGTLLTLRQGVQANWLLPFIPAVLVAIAGRASGPGGDPRRRAWLRRGLWSGALCMAVAWVLPWLPLERGLAGRAIDPLHGLRGWSAAAREVQALRVSLPGWEALPVLVYGHRRFASALAFHLPDRPRVAVWPAATGRVRSQYDLWGLPAMPAGGDALVVLAGRRDDIRLPRRLLDRFGQLVPAGELVQTPGPGRHRYWRLFQARGWRPAPR